MNAKLMSSLIACIFTTSSFAAVAADAMAPVDKASAAEPAVPAKHKPVKHKNETMAREKKEEAAESKKDESKESPAQERKEEHKAPKK